MTAVLCDCAITEKISEKDTKKVIMGHNAHDTLNNMTAVLSTLSVDRKCTPRSFRNACDALRFRLLHL